MLDTIEIQINELFAELINFSDTLIEERFIADILVNDLNTEDINRNFDKFIFTKSTSMLKSISLLLKNNDIDGSLILTRTLLESYEIGKAYRRDTTISKQLYYNSLKWRFEHLYIENNKVICNKNKSKGCSSLSRLKEINEGDEYLRIVYSYLSAYVHVDLITQWDYIDRDGFYSTNCYVDNNIVISIALYIYLKLFNMIIVWGKYYYAGDNYIDRGKKLYFKGLLVIKKVLDIVIDEYENIEKPYHDRIQNYIETLTFSLKVMKNKTNKEIRKHKKSIVKATF